MRLHENQVTISLATTTSTQYKDGGGGNTGVNYKVPPCWYQPVQPQDGAASFQKLLQQYNFDEHHTDPGGQGWPDFPQWLQGWTDQLAAHENDKPPGAWYESDCTDWSTSAAQAWGQSNPDFLYVPANTAPVGGVPTITPATLAQYALASTVLPPPTPTFSPDPTQPSYVNLPTWAWQSAGNTLDLTATLGAQSATVVMTPTAMTVTSDGPTARGVPNVCRQVGTVIGVPWVRGDSEPTSPGCGLTFTAPGNYVVHADVIWQITWTSPQVTGVQTFPDVHMNTDTAITSKEIETIN